MGWAMCVAMFVVIATNDRLDLWQTIALFGVAALFGIAGAIGSVASAIRHRGDKKPDGCDSR